jgi:3-hydroxymyristoyl/3-hydroxydecanoyl-(acyl carrier protein) dehydratase
MKKAIPTEIQGAQIPPYYPPPGLNPCFVWKPRDPKKRPCWELTDEEKLNPPNGVLFDEEDLLQFAEGHVAPVFGPAYKEYDTYRRRTKLPGREYLLVSRVTSMKAKTNVFEAGATMVTEYDLPYNSELSEGGDVPWAVLVESGQCDLMLISYLGVDFQCRGDRVYRLLDTTLTFYGVAREGETLKYDIQVNGFAKNPNGDISIFFFSYNCYCNGKLLIEMRNGAAGFFTDEELAAGKGVIKTVGDKKARSLIKKQDITPFVVAKPSKSAFNEQDMQNLVKGEWGTVMDGNAGRAALKYKLCAKKVLMIDRITHLDYKGGAYGLGFLVGEKILAPDMWFFPCHFPGDQVMAGSLVSDGCSQMLKTYMIYLGLQSLAGPNPLFRPVPGNPNKVRCRGQISPHRGKLVYCMEIRSLGIDADGCPFAIADVDIIDVNTERGQSFSLEDMDAYGNGDLNKKIVVDFKGIALRIERGPVDGVAPVSAPVSSNGSSVSNGHHHSSPLTVQGVLVKPVPPPLSGMKLGEPAAPSEVTWHPLAKSLGGTKLNFYPSKFAPRSICFVPFDASNDINRTPGKLPFTWWHLSEFMCGKVSNCLGEEFKRFDVSKTSRSPAFDLQVVTRVLSVDGMIQKPTYGVDVDPSHGSMVAEFDCPKDAKCLTLS